MQEEDVNPFFDLKLFIYRQESHFCEKKNLWIDFKNQSINWIKIDKKLIKDN